VTERGSDEPEEGQEESGRIAALGLALASGLRDWEKARLVERAGGPRGVLNLFAESERRSALTTARDELEKCKRHGFSVVIRGDSNYPELLEQTYDPPGALFAWGTLKTTDGLAIAIVGARRASPYGAQVAELLSRQLATRGVTIVSGLARGIDAVAHRAALEAGGRTVAVLGSGLLALYPREHEKLAARIAENGAVLSEHALEAAPLPGNFPRRNRILSGLTLGTLVVEAARGSGSLITARHAIEQNREVYAVPGPVGQTASEGCHDLIQQGAKLVTCADDVIAELPPSARARLMSKPAGVPEGKALTDHERRVLERLPRLGACDPDQLAAEGLPVRCVLAALMALELKGLIRAFPGGSYARTSD